MCHFYIYVDLHSGRGATNSLKVWVDNLFPFLDGPIKSLQAPVKDKWITRVMKISEHEDVIFDEDDGGL